MGIYNFSIFNNKIIKHKYLQEYNSHRIPKENFIFCQSPFNSLLFESDGTVYPCCHNYKYNFGKYPLQSIKEIWTNRKINIFKRAIKNNNLSLGCDVCKFDIENKCYNTVQALMFDNFPVNKNGYPSMLDFMLENTCNLECVMCNGLHSSTIRKHRENREYLKSPYDDNFILQLEEFIPYLHTARFSGGETFLIDIYYKIWEKIIEINPKCKIRVQTNATTLNNKVKEILNKGNFEINVSLDSITKSNYEKIRVHSNFEKVIDNIKYYSYYSWGKNNIFGITICPMRFNWRELPDLVRFCNSVNALIWFSVVWLPPNVAIWTLDSENLKEIYLTLSKIKLSENNQIESENNKYYQDLLKVINKWYKDAIEREKKNDVVKLSVFKESLKNNFRIYLKSFDLDKKEKEFMLQEFNQKIEIIYSKFNPNDKIIKNYINSIVENSSAIQLIDMLKRTPENEMYDIVKSFLA